MPDEIVQPATAPVAAPKSTHKKRLIILAVFVGLFLAGAGSSWLYVYFREKPTSQVLQEASKLEESGKLVDALAYYDAAIKKTDDTGLKAFYTIGQASIYLNDGDADKALTVALKAMDIKASDNSAAFIARIYENKGDRAKAIEYYQKAIGLIDKSQTLSGEDIKYYQLKIDILSGVNE